MKKEKKEKSWKTTTIDIDIDSIVKNIHGEDYSGVFDLLGTKLIYVNGKGYFQKDLVNERLKEF
jgi:hypothetical protein